jgi:hypothetical protein
MHPVIIATRHLAMASNVVVFNRASHPRHPNHPNHQGTAQIAAGGKHLNGRQEQQCCH